MDHAFGYAHFVISEEVPRLNDGIDEVFQRVWNAQIPHRYRHHIDVGAEKSLDQTLDLGP